MTAVGAFERTAASMCVRFGSTGTWTRAGTGTVQVAQPILSPTFTPTTARSSSSVTVTIRGTGFFAGGAQQTMVKVAGSEGCGASGSSDVSSVAGGTGRVCDTIYWTEVDQLQSCEVRLVPKLYFHRVPTIFPRVYCARLGTFVFPLRFHPLGNPDFSDPSRLGLTQRALFYRSHAGDIRDGVSHRRCGERV